MDKPDGEDRQWQLGKATPERRTQQTLTWLLWFLGGMACWGIVIYSVSAKADRQFRLLRSGAVAQGKVVLGSHPGAKGSTYYVYYDFPANNEVYSGMLRTNKERYEALMHGGRYFTVLYNPEKPLENLIYKEIKDAYLVAKS